MKGKKAKILDLNNDNDSKIYDDKEDPNLNLNYSGQDDEEKKKIDPVIVPFKKYYLKIFKNKDDKSHYYILDRLKYDINTIMMLLDLNKINKLSEIFKEYEDGIEKIIFINKMKAELPCNLTDPMDETNLVYGLYKFFKEVDFNGDNQMQWTEFTQFIIDKVEGDGDAKVNEVDAETNTNKIFSEKQMIKYKRYHESNKLFDNLIHKKDVVSAVFLPRVDLIVLNEYNTRFIKIYSPRTGRCEKNFDLDDYINPKIYLDNDKKFKRKKPVLELKIKEKKKLGKIEKNNKNTNYSILHLYQYQNIVAMCLSDKRIVFLNFASDERIEFIHEIQLPTIEKRVWFLPEHNIWVSSGCKLDRFNYFTLNELDIELEHYNQKYQCLYNEGHPYRTHYCEMLPHRGEILDCIEISKPMLIITACMDSKIRLINISERGIVKMWNNHSLGVRALNYNPLIENNGYILSVGFEYFINIYCTDLSIEEAYKGKLEGHYSPVINCQFLSNSYMAVSVDEECCVRIWDTKLKICLQVIPTPKKNFKVVNLLCLPKYNRFVVFGNKIIYYDPKYKEEENIQKNQVKDDNYPIKIEYNKYYQQFFVVTFRDVRVYDKEGNLFKVYRKITYNDHFDNEPKIKYFIFENNFRKFYVGYSNGAIMQFNAGNGSLIKAINEKEVEKDGLQTFVYSHTKEITSLYYYYSDEEKNDDKKEDNEKKSNQHLILLSTSYDSLINVYNEGDPEETLKLKTIRGGHTIAGKVNEINCLDFSKMLNSYATGSTDGLVVVWDFEMSKINDIFYLSSHRNEKLNTNFIKFLEPYPLLAACYSDSSLYIWGVKQCKDRGECVFRARNYFMFQHKIDTCPIKYMNIYYGDLPDMKYEVPLLKYFDENSPFMNPHVKYVPPQKKKIEKEKNKNDKMSSISDYNNKNNKKEDSEEEIIDEDLNLDIVPDIYKNEIIDIYNDPHLYEQDTNINKTSNKNLNINNDENIRKRLYLIIGDSFGNIKMIDFYGFIKKNKYEISSKITNKSAFNLLKKEDLNVETILNHNLKYKEESSLPKYTNMYYKMIRNEFRAHLEDITCITVIEEPLCFVTTSKDKYVKIYNFNCDCLGIINSLPKLSKFDIPRVKWTFKINEEKILGDEIKEIVDIFEKVGVEKILVGSKLDKEVDEIDINDKIKQEQEVKKKEKGFVKKKFKHLEKDEKTKKIIFHEKNINVSYEGFYVQEAQRSIENKMAEKFEKYGINEITSNIIRTVVDTKKKKKLREKSEEKLNLQLQLQNDNNDYIKSKGKRRKTFNRQASIKTRKLNDENNNNTPKAINNYAKNEKSLFQSYMDNKNNLNKGVIKKEFNKTYSTNFNYQKTLSSFNFMNNINTNTNGNITPLNKNEKFTTNALPIIKEKEKENYYFDDYRDEKQKKMNLKKIHVSFFSPSPKTSTNTENKDNPVKIRRELLKKLSEKSLLNISLKKKDPNNKFKSILFFEKFLGGKKKNENKNKKKDDFMYKTRYNSFSNQNEERFKEKLKHLQLPIVSDKIIFSKGETEKLLNYEFYSSSYKACCEIQKQNSVDNTCMKTNSSNNWKLVREYTKDQKDISWAKQEKMMNRTSISNNSKKWTSLKMKKKKILENIL